MSLRYNNIEKMYPTNKVVPIDYDLWKACAGSNVVNVPEVGTKVYYFPEGHAEQCHYAHPPQHLVGSIFPCRVLQVRYFVDQMTDELSAAILLQQVGNDFHCPPPKNLEEGSRIDSFMKVLTQSDANNGGGFSVPRQCAESIFPPLNYGEDPPVQNLTISDVQGVNWMFRHIYRGKPKRHLLTTGWSKFVNHKKLTGGDTIIFMRDNATRKKYIGIRRLRKNTGRRSLLSARLVEDAAMRAARGLPFEVVVYPRSGMSDFVVNAYLVDRALNSRWAIGMRVQKDAAEEDLAGRACLQGHVSFVKDVHECGSLWKILQVTWTEPEHLQNVEMLNPWQVECANHQSYVPLQRINSQCGLVVPNIFHPLATRIWNTKCLMGKRGILCRGCSQPLCIRNTHLASMGAKHLSNASGLIGNHTHQMQSKNTLQRINTHWMRSRINEGHPTGNPCSIMVRDKNDSIQLFGKHICVKNHVQYQKTDVDFLETYKNEVSCNEEELKIPRMSVTPVEGN